MHMRLDLLATERPLAYGAPAANEWRGTGMAGNGSSLRGRFQDVVTSEAELREVVSPPSGKADAKVISFIDDVAAAFIAQSPFVLIASANADGEMDVSPKGDPAGFVKVLDEKTVAVPDRVGNRRLDTFRNVVQNPRVGLIFLVPGVTHTLRVSGTAIIVRDRALRESMEVKGKLPDHVLVVEVERVLSHCAKCMVRSRLWQPEAWPDAAGVPTLGEILVAHAGLAETAAEVETFLEKDTREQLY
jgi:PPOX class probable FMN-dependent enzyme